MASPKKYVPMSMDDAEAYVEKVGTDLSAEMTMAECLIYAELLKVHERIDEIENQANEMMSPEKMVEMAQGFLGGSLT